MSDIAPCLIRYVGVGHTVRLLCMDFLTMDRYICKTSTFVLALPDDWCLIPVRAW